MKVLQLMLAWLIVYFALCLTVFPQQSSTGRISGRVLDLNGAVIPEATVRVIHIDTETLRSIVTNSDGVSLGIPIYYLVVRPGVSQAANEET